MRAMILAGLVLAPGGAWGFDPGNPAASGYALTFSDNFTVLNSAVWETDWWYDAATQTACQKAFLPGTLLTSAAGLDLHIQSLETVPACAGVAGYSWAHLDASRGFGQKLGYYEARIQSSAAGGTLTAFWLLPSSGAWPPELDIEEIRGDYPATAYMTNHYGTQNKQTQYVFTAPASLGGAYHTYGALLTSTTITWYIDDVRRGQTSRSAGEGAKLFPIFSLYTGNCGDGWAGCPSQATGWSADAHVAWVHGWQKK